MCVAGGGEGAGGGGFVKLRTQFLSGKQNRTPILQFSNVGESVCVSVLVSMPVWHTCTNSILTRQAEITSYSDVIR